MKACSLGTSGEASGTLGIGGLPWRFQGGPILKYYGHQEGVCVEKHTRALLGLLQYTPMHSQKH